MAREGPLVVADEDVTIYWRPHQEVYPKFTAEQDFLAFVEGRERSTGRVFLMKHSTQAGRWLWSMFAHLTTGAALFPITGYADTSGDAERRVVEAYRKLLAHNERHPRKNPARP